MTKCKFIFNTYVYWLQYGWYWGPISGEAAEKVLSNEPDGSFIVRDSSDHHYIFSLTFRLNGCVRHVRIEHDQGKYLIYYMNVYLFVDGKSEIWYIELIHLCI